MPEGKKIGFFDRLRGTPSKNVVTTDPLPSPELERHRTQVASFTETLVDTFDTRAAKRIGITGSIRREIFSRKPQRREDGIYIKDMKRYPLSILALYIKGDRLHMRFDNKEEGPEFMYTIDCYNGTFTPTIYQQTQDGFLELSVLTGQTGESYNRTTISKTYNDTNLPYKKRILNTFMPAYDGSPSEYPLTLSYIPRDGIRDGTFEMIYSGLDADGNVTLLDGQRTPWGKYSAAAHSFSETLGPAPKVKVENNMLYIDTLPYPITTNIYQELRTITADLPPIEQ